MSMWEVEDLVELGVRLVVKLQPGDARDLVHRLYGLQGRFDCSFTHFRVAAALQTLGYLVRIPVEDHPVPARVVELKGLRTKGREAWLVDGGETHGLYQPGTATVAEGLYVDPTMSGWQAAGAAGLLVGAAAAPLPALDPIEDIARLITFAVTADNVDLAHGLVGLALQVFAKAGLTPSTIDQRLVAAHDALVASGLLAKRPTDWIEERFPTDVAVLEEFGREAAEFLPEAWLPFARWWTATN